MLESLLPKTAASAVVLICWPLLPGADAAGPSGAADSVRVAFWGRVLTSRGITVFWLLWAGLFVAMLLLVAPGANSQDAQEAEILQGQLAAGYQLRNPPLYDWLLWGVQQLVGSGPSSCLIVRYSLIAATGVLFYYAVLRVAPDRQVAAAFSLSLVLLYWFGWEAHAEVSHSLAVILMLLALWLAALNYVDRRCTARALMLGIAIGVGLLAKWSFFFVVLGLGIALAMEEKYRPAFTDKASLIIPVAAALVILPSLLWAADLDPIILASNVNVPKSGSTLGRTLRMLGQFAGILCVVFLPWAIVVIAQYFRFRSEVRRDVSTDMLIRIAFIAAVISGGTVVAILLASTLSGLNLFGISDFAPHYLQPFCILATIGVAGLIAGRVDSLAFARRLGLVSLLMALMIFVAKLASFYVVPTRLTMGHLLPYRELANQLDARGFAQAQFVALSARDAGNLMMYLPQARALSPSRRQEPPPPDPLRERPCVLLWGGEYYVPPNKPKQPRPSRFLSALGLNLDEHVIESIHVNWRQPLIGEFRRSVWYLLWDPSAEQICRRFVSSGGVLW